MNKALFSLIVLFFIPFTSFSQIIIEQEASAITLECGDSLDDYLASNGGAVASSTSCEDNNLVWTHAYYSDNSPCSETITVIFTVADGCGNAATTDGTVNIRDTTAPIISLPAEYMTVTCDGTGNTDDFNTWLASNGGAMAYDNCSDVTWSNHTSDDSSFDCSTRVEIATVFTANDDCGNSSDTIGVFIIEAAPTPCPTGHIILSSQADVDAFSTNYPNCLEITHGLTISGSDITDLSPLSAITSVEGPIASGLIIKDNPLLTNLNGIENISIMQYGNLVIENNALLNNILGLSGLSGEVGDSIIIKDNPLLVSLDGLGNVTNPFADDLVIDNNDSLSNFNGLESLIYADDVFIINNDGLISFGGLTAFEFSGDFHIENNSSLNSFNGLNSIDKVYNLLINNNNLLQDIAVLDDVNINSTVSITNNPLLPVCNINSICYFLNQWDSVNNPSAVVIDNNDVGCNDISEVESTCVTLIPENDDCTGADVLTLGESLIASNRYSTISANVPSCNIDSQFRADVWFSFNTGELTTIDILVDGGYSLQLWQGTCGALTQVAEACGANALNEISVGSNTDYFVQVWFDNSDSQGKTVSNMNIVKITEDFEIVVKNSSALSLEESLTLEFTLYPNPINEELIINNGNNSIIENIQIYSMFGEKLIETTKTSINFSKISAGMYFVEIQTGNGRFVKKVIKK
ncbi:T9SS type A sorting domain-containing protein [Algibacter sp. R77976]|uniref:T9SS type A sorting domain-containing protein n=1 Tax=Algibacter sp. R77976 TaxID=3093873 RepID=UPI0037C80564